MSHNRCRHIVQSEIPRIIKISWITPMFGLPRWTVDLSSLDLGLLTRYLVNELYQFGSDQFVAKEWLNNSSSRSMIKLPYLLLNFYSWILNTGIGGRYMSTITSFGMMKMSENDFFHSRLIEDWTSSSLWQITQLFYYVTCNKIKED